MSQQFTESDRAVLAQLLALQVPKEEIAARLKKIGRPFIGSWGRKGDKSNIGHLSGSFKLQMRSGKGGAEKGAEKGISPIIDVCPFWPAEDGRLTCGSTLP